MTIHLNGTDQYLIISGLAASTAYGIDITTGTNHLPNGFGNGTGVRFLQDGKASFATGDYCRSNGANMEFASGVSLQIDSGTVYNSGNAPTVTTLNGELSANCVLKIRDCETASNTLSSYEGGQYVLHLFAQYNGSDGGGDYLGIGFIEAYLDEIILRNSGGTALATFDLTTPATSYTNNGYTLDFIQYAAADTTAPVFDVGPAVTATSGTGHTISQTMDEDCTVYGVRLADGATTPSAAQVKAGQDSTGSAAPEAQNAAALASSSMGLTFSTGAVSTPYKYCIVAEDASSNITTVQVVNATTSAGSIAIDGGVLTAGAAFTGTYSGIGSLASPITLTDSAGNTLNVAITDLGSGTFSGTMPSLPSSGSASSILFGSVSITGGA